MPKPIAVIRRDIIAQTGPSVFGITRNTRLKNASGEVFIFLGACDGIAHLEREDKTKGEPFVHIDSLMMRNYSKA